MLRIVDLRSFQVEIPNCVQSLLHVETDWRECLRETGVYPLSFGLKYVFKLLQRQLHKLVYVINSQECFDFCVVVNVV